MRPPVAHKLIRARLKPRQGAAASSSVAGSRNSSPVNPFATYFTAGTAMTATAVPTATELVMNSLASASPLFPTLSPSVSSISGTTESLVTKSKSTTSPASATQSNNAKLPDFELDPFQRVYLGMTMSSLRARPSWVIIGAICGATFLVLLVAYCYICRWYYKRLPRSSARWDVDDFIKKGRIYGAAPHESEKPTQPIQDDRRTVPVGDSYFPQGETWRKFEGRTARHPESFIYTGDDQPHAEQALGSPVSPPVSTRSNNLPRPRPRFAQQNPRRGQIESVFSTVSFPTTHRAESVRESNFFPNGFEHDGELWDIASPSPSRPSYDFSARPMSTRRASIFGEASGRARGSIVVYDSEPVWRASMLDAASPTSEGNTSPGEKYGGKRSIEGYQMHVRNRSKDVRQVQLGTLVEDADEDMTRSGKTTPIPHL